MKLLKIAWIMFTAALWFLAVFFRILSHDGGGDASAPGPGLRF